MSLECGVFTSILLKQDTPFHVMGMLHYMAKSATHAECHYEQNKELYPGEFFDDPRWAHMFTETLAGFPFWSGAFIIDDEREKSFATAAVVKQGTVDYCQQFLEWLRPWIVTRNVPAVVSVCEMTPNCADMLYVLENGTIAQVSKEVDVDLTKTSPALAIPRCGLFTTFEENMKQ